MPSFNISLDNPATKALLSNRHVSWQQLLLYYLYNFEIRRTAKLVER